MSRIDGDDRIARCAFERSGAQRLRVWGGVVMTPLNPASFAYASRRASMRALDRNPRAALRIETAIRRNHDSLKTNPIDPSLPNGAARCAFVRSGAQRQQNQKSSDFRIFSRPSVRPGGTR
jgi:hypothetical protein